MTSRVWLLAAIALVSGACAAAEEKDTRGGTCEDAKSQHEYFCEGKGFKDDIFVKSPIACKNAKRNMAAACDGVVEKDVPYKFDDQKAEK